MKKKHKRTPQQLKKIYEKQRMLMNKNNNKSNGVLTIEGYLQKEKETLQQVLDNGEKEQSYNLQDFDGSVSLDELFEIRGVIDNLLEDWVGGSSIEGNGTNFNFTFNGKPYMLRISKDEFHTKHWIEDKIGYWEETDEPKEYKNGVEVK